MVRELTLDGIRIADDSDALVIAEIGHNHGGCLETCKALFGAAKAAGAHAVKLQKRDNRTLYTRAFYEQPYHSENAFGPTYGAHREALEFGWDEYVELRTYANALGITFFATAFDHRSVGFLAKLEVPAIKIASGDLKNTPLLKHAAQVGVPLIVSTGGGTLADVDRAVDTVLAVHDRLALLQCTMTYPCRFEELNLRVIETYRQRYPGLVVGLSGHDNGIAMAVAAYVLGARIIEKHFTLNRAAKGSDHAFSLEPVGMGKLVRDLRRARLALGDGEKRFLQSEYAAEHKMGKGLYAARDLPAGHVLTAEDIAIKSPAGGLSPRLFERLIGQRLDAPMQADEPFLRLADAG